MPRVTGSDQYRVPDRTNDDPSGDAAGRCEAGSLNRSIVQPPPRTPPHPESGQSPHRFALIVIWLLIGRSYKGACFSYAPRRARAINYPLYHLASTFSGSATSAALFHVAHRRFVGGGILR